MRRRTMTFKYIPSNFRKAILDLTKDEEFQKIYAEDKVLDELLAKEAKAADEYLELYKKADQRSCQLVIDYLLEHKELYFGFFNLKLMRITNNKILGFIRNYLVNKLRDSEQRIRATIMGDDED